MAIRYWRDRIQLYRLVGSKCKKCGRVYFPKRKVCFCGSREMEEYKLPEKGRLVCFTVVRYPPREFEGYAPYPVGIIELEDGTKVLAQLTDVDVEALSEGAEVEFTLRRLREDGERGVIFYGYKFRPRLRSGS